MKHIRSRQSSRALSLIEVLVSVGILAIIGVGSMAVMMYSERQTRHAIDDMVVLELLNRQTELVRSAQSYAQLGDPAFAPGGSGALDSTTPDPSFTRTRNFQYDPDDTYGAANAPIFNITYQWYGFGTVTSSSATTISFDDSAWPADVDFGGHRVLLRPSAGTTAAAIADITAHGEGSFTCDSAINDWGESDFGFTVPAGMNFEVDGGKWVRVTISWSPDFQLGGSQVRSFSRDIFIPWRRDVVT